MNRITTILLVFALMLLGACQSTQKSNEQASKPNQSGSGASEQLSSLSFIHQQAELMAESFNEDKDDAFYDWWERQHLLSYAHNEYPDLSLAEEDVFYRFVRTKFTNQLKATEMWSFDGVQGQNLVFSGYLKDMPIAILFTYEYIHTNGQKKLVIVNWKMMHHLTRGLDAYFAYHHNGEALAQSGYLELFNTAVNLGVKTESEVADIFDNLPKTIKEDKTLLNDFIWSSFAVVKEPSLEFVNQLYEYAPSLTLENSAFWGYFYMMRDDLVQYQHIRNMAMANLGYLQTNYALEGVLYSLQKQDEQYAFQEFVQYIKPNPNDVMAYVLYLNNLIDLELHERASMVYQAISLQFDFKLTAPDFVDMDPQKISMFFNSDAMKKVSVL